MPKESLKDQLAAHAATLGTGAAMGSLTGQSLPGAVLGTIKDMALEKVLGPAAGLAGILLGVSRTVTKIVRDTDQWGKGIVQLRQIEQLQSKFEAILKSTTLAKERMKELSAMSVNSPFNLQELAGASRNLELLTKGAWASKAALESVGDVAAATGGNIEDIAFTLGKLNNNIQAGRSIQNLAFQLQSLGVLSGDAQTKIESLEAANASGAEKWAVVTKELERTRGAMAAEMTTIGGLTSRLQSARDVMAKGFAQPFENQEKNSIYQTLKMTEAMSPVLNLIAKDVSAVTSVYRGLGKEMSSVTADALKSTGVLEGLWSTFAAGAVGVGASVAANIGGVLATIGKTTRGIDKNIAGGKTSDEARKWRRAEAMSRSGSREAFAEAGQLLSDGSLVEAGSAAVRGVFQKGKQAVSHLGGIGAAASHSARSAASAAALEAGEDLSAGALQAIGAKAAAAAVSLTAARAGLSGIAAAGSKALGALVGIGASIPVLGWVAIAVGATGYALFRFARASSEAKQRIVDLNKVLDESRQAFLEQANAIVTAEQRGAALARVYDLIAKATAKRNATKDPKEIARLDKELEVYKTDAGIVAKTKVTSRLDPKYDAIHAERINYEKYQAPLDALDAQAQGASPVMLAEISRKRLEIRRKEEADGEAALEERDAYENSDKGMRNAQIANQLGNGPSARIQSAIAEQKDIQDASKTRGVGELDPDEVKRRKTAWRAAQVEIDRLETMVKPSDKTGAAGEAENETRRSALEDWDKKRTSALRTEQVATSFDETAAAAADYAANEKVTKWVSSRPEMYASFADEDRARQELEANPDDKGKREAYQKLKEGNSNLRVLDAGVKQNAATASAEARREAQAKAAFAEKSRSGELHNATTAEGYGVTAAKNAAALYTHNLKLERQIFDIKEAGWAGEEASLAASLSGAKEELAIRMKQAQEMGNADSGIKAEGEQRIRVAERELLLAKATNAEKLRVMRAPLVAAEKQNEIDMAKLKGQPEQAKYLTDEEEKRQNYERLRDARMQGGDPAMHVEKRKMLAEKRAELIAKAQDKQGEAVDAIKDPWEKNRVAHGLKYQGEIDALKNKGMSESDARSKVAEQHGGDNSEFSSAINAADIFKKGLGDQTEGIEGGVAKFDNNLVTPGKDSAPTPEEAAKKGVRLDKFQKAQLAAGMDIGMTTDEISRALDGDNTADGGALRGAVDSARAAAGEEKDFSPTQIHDQLIANRGKPATSGKAGTAIPKNASPTASITQGIDASTKLAAILAAIQAGGTIK